MYRFHCYFTDILLSSVGVQQSGTSRKVADYVPGQGLPALRQNADTAAGAIAKAKIVRDATVLSFLDRLGEVLCDHRYAGP